MKTLLLVLIIGIMLFICINAVADQLLRHMVLQHSVVLASEEPVYVVWKVHVLWYTVYVSYDGVECTVTVYSTHSKVEVHRSAPSTPRLRRVRSIIGG